MSEDQIQAAAYQWFHNTYPIYRGCLFAVPNGGTRHKIEAMKLKATGQVNGIPDMMLVIGGKAWGIEFKTESGRQSPDQLDIQKKWAANCNPYFVVRSLEQFQAVILSALSMI